MLSDIEELAREGMREFTATVHVSPDLAARAYRQHRRRVAAYASAAGAVGVAGAAAVAVSLVLPATNPAARHPAASNPAPSNPVPSKTAGSPGIQLAAWTVTRQADGNIKITFRQAADVAGLQSTLRADGVPASVTLAGQQNPACRPFTGSQAFWPYGKTPGPFGAQRFAHNPKGAFSSPYALVIDPSRLPAGAGVQIVVSGTPGTADDFSLHTSLVRTSPQCTGS
jgi:hypothetical protein